MLFQCWASVEDDGPTLEQHRVIVYYLLWKNIKNMRCWYMVAPMRRRRWDNIVTTLVQFIVFAGVK